MCSIAVGLVAVTGFLCGGDAVSVAGALEVCHIAGGIAVTQLAVAARTAQAVVVFGRHKCFFSLEGEAPVWQRLLIEHYMHNRGRHQQVGD